MKRGVKRGVNLALTLARSGFGLRLGLGLGLGIGLGLGLGLEHLYSRWMRSRNARSVLTPPLLISAWLGAASGLRLGSR